MRRDGGPQVPMAARQSHGRHQRNQLHDVHEGRARGLRPLGPAGQRRLELRGRASVLQEVGGPAARRPGSRVPHDGAPARPRRVPQGPGAVVEDAAGTGVLAGRPRAGLRHARRLQRSEAARLFVRAGHHGPWHPL